MKISSRREEIEILQLIGATYRYIRTPFLIEGAIYGLVGSLLALTLGAIILSWAGPSISAFFEGIALLPLTNEAMLTVAASGLGGGMLIGVFGSFLALKRFRC